MSVKYWLDCNPQSGKVLMRHRSDGLNHRFRGAGPAGPPHSRRDQPRRISSLRLGGPQNPGPHVAQANHSRRHGPPHDYRQPDCDLAQPYGHCHRRRRLPPWADRQWRSNPYRRMAANKGRALASQGKDGPCSDGLRLGLPCGANHSAGRLGSHQERAYDYLGVPRSTRCRWSD